MLHREWVPTCNPYLSIISMVNSSSFTSTSAKSEYADNDNDNDNGIAGLRYGCWMWYAYNNIVTWQHYNTILQQHSYFTTPYYNNIVTLHITTPHDILTITLDARCLRLQRIPFERFLFSVHLVVSLEDISEGSNFYWVYLFERAP